MTLRGRAADGTTKTFTQVRMRDTGNVLQTIERIRGRDATNTLRTFFSFFSVSLSSNQVNGFDTGAATSGPVTSALCTATVSGGTAPYTYSWTYVSGDPEVEIDDAADDDTTFTVADAASGYIYEAYFICTVTDSLSNVVVSEQVRARLRWIDIT